MTRVTRRGPQTKSDPLSSKITEFAAHKAMADQISKRMTALKDDMMAILESEGRPDEKGSMWIEFPTPVAGCEAIQRQRRVSTLFNEEVAERTIKSAGLWFDAVRTTLQLSPDVIEEVLELLKDLDPDSYDIIETIDDDRLAAAYYADQNSEDPKLTPAQFAEFFTEKVSYAFVPKWVG
jgi:hypothetical protein